MSDFVKWAEKGYGVIPVGADRRPLLKRWTQSYAKSPVEAAEMQTKYPQAQVGIVTGSASGIVVVDLDNKGGGDAVAALRELQREGWPKTFTVKTQTGGLHLYYKDPGGVKTCSNWRPHVDIRADGGQVVAPGSMGATGSYEVLIDMEPAVLGLAQAVALPRKGSHASGQPADTPTSSGLIVAGMPFVPPEKVRTGERDQTIFRYAASMQARDIPQEEATRIISAYYDTAVVDKQGFTLEDALDKVEQAYTRYAKAVEDEINEDKQELPDPEEGARLKTALFESLERYIFVEADGVYFDRWSNSWKKSQSLAESMRRVKAWLGDRTRDKKPKMVNLWDLFKTNRGVTCVDGVCYEPFKDPIVSQRRATYLNRWTKPSLDSEPGDVKIFVDHLRAMLGDDEEALTFALDWMACLVQHPGEKIGSTILLSSTEQGLGKSVIGKVLSKILGEGNVANISAQQIESAHNTWLEESSLAIVEEFKILGRWKLANKLKDLITNDTVRINPKFRSEYNAVNHCNFIFFSNYPDAAALEGLRERRTFVSHTDMTKDELAAKFSTTKEDYYGKLWAWTKGRGPAYFAHFLNNRDIESFYKWGRFEPPMTDSKRFAVRANMSPLEEWLEDGFHARDGVFSCDLVSVESVRAAAEIDRIQWSDRSVHELRRWLRSRTSPAGVIGWRGKTIRVQSLRDHLRWAGAAHGERQEEYQRGVEASLRRE